MKAILNAVRRFQHHSLQTAILTTSSVVLNNNNLMTTMVNQKQQRQSNHHMLQITRQLAGHNKWSKIKRKKAANDVARARDHTKAARAIESASRSCRGDCADISLQSAIAAARAVQLPKERIEKAIERGTNPNTKNDLSVRRRYDGMIPVGGSGGKIAIIIETLTENRNRTAANIRHLVTKIGGELLPTGANDWLFEHVGVVCVSRKKCNNYEAEVADMAELLECALEGGASDVDFGLDEDEGSPISNNEDDDADNHVTIKCETSDLLRLVQSLKAGGFVSTQFDNQWLVRSEDTKVILDEEDSEQLEKFLDSMDEDFDVINVYHNAAVGAS